MGNLLEKVIQTLITLNNEPKMPRMNKEKGQPLMVALLTKLNGNPRSNWENGSLNPRDSMIGPI